VTSCDKFVYRLNAVAYPDTPELSFEKECAKCPPQDPVELPLPAGVGVLDLAAAGPARALAILDRINRPAEPRPDAQPVSWPVLVRTGRTGGMTPGIPRYIVLRGTVSRVEESLPGASVHWADVSFREAPDTPDSNGKLYGVFNVCTSNSDIFQDVSGADFSTSMIGKAIEVEGEIRRSYCKGLKGSIRITLAHQLRVVKPRCSTWPPLCPHRSSRPRMWGHGNLP
jgi:hypothetical protein